jgi:nucleotide-binding universal stress UspA family protein
MKSSAKASPKTLRMNPARRNGLRQRVSVATIRNGAFQAQVIPAIKLSRILVPVDFSRASIKPLSYASAIAKVHGAKIVLLHITKPISFCVDCGYGPVNRRVTDDAQIRKDRSLLRRSAAKHVPPESMENIIIRSGKASEQILSTAKELKADLIVLYAHEANESNSVGSHETVDRVMRLAPCPVLIVRAHEQDFIQPIGKRRQVLQRP